MNVGQRAQHVDACFCAMGLARSSALSQTNTLWGSLQRPSATGLPMTPSGSPALWLTLNSGCHVDLLGPWIDLADSTGPKGRWPHSCLGDLQPSGSIGGWVPLCFSFISGYNLGAKFDNSHAENSSYQYVLAVLDDLNPRT